MLLSSHPEITHPKLTTRVIPTPSTHHESTKVENTGKALYIGIPPFMASTARYWPTPATDNEECSSYWRDVSVKSTSSSR
jgi:hypothetical protein